MAKNKNKKQLDDLFLDPYLGQPEPEQTSQKRSFIVVSAALIVALVLGVWYLTDTIANPFELESVDNDTNAVAVSPGTTAPLTGIESLRSKDTDNDGISDYDEFYIFKTSPYIADSDSDGISDLDEINAGTDPNCPEGENCNRTIIADQNTADDIFGEINPDAKPQSGITDPEDVTADELRQILRDAGASEEELSQISDEDLLQTYREIQADRGITDADTSTTNSKTNVNTDPTSATGDDVLADPAVTLQFLQSLSPDEIRQFLVDSGVPEETLTQIDDDTLQEIFTQSIQQNVDELNLQP